ncbi:MAG TPA: tetratricopeptide repeat protein [Vineibacter sp.]|nr:tetratricopeptide repeat protein [Vineibacter sp.]
MPILGALLLGLDIIAIVHIVRNGYPQWWIYVVLFAPGVGAVAFFLFGVLPDLGKTQAGRTVIANVRRSIDPDRDLRERAKAFDRAGTPQNAIDLAEELSRRGFPDDAIDLYGRVMTGLYENDPTLLIGRARAEFGKGDFAAARASLERVQQHHPGYVSREGHLLYARSVEALGDVGQAAEEYEALIPTYPGPEAKVRYALMLDRLGDKARARTLFADVVQAHEDRRGQMLPDDRHWFDEARRHVAA